MPGNGSWIQSKCQVPVLPPISWLPTQSPTCHLLPTLKCIHPPSQCCSLLTALAELGQCNSPAPRACSGMGRSMQPLHQPPLLFGWCAYGSCRGLDHSALVGNRLYKIMLSTAFYIYPAFVRSPSPFSLIFPRENVCSYLYYLLSCPLLSVYFTGHNSQSHREFKRNGNMFP